jgi:RimJ/RimL family protein N-acetyltransferase
MRAVSTTGHEIVLRPATVADAEQIVAWHAEPDMTEHMPMRLLTVEQMRAQLAARATVVVGPMATGTAEWMIEVDGAPAGRIRLTIESRSHKIASLGYSLSGAHRGNGAMSTSVRLVTALALDPEGFDIERVEAIASVENAASCRVLERSGFQFEGIRRGYLIIRGRRVDHATYSRLRSDEEQTAP